MGFSVCLVGCHGASSVPPAIERLAEELPVETSQFRFLNCKINRQDENSTSPIRMSPGESFSFEGEIVSGDWCINRIHQTWRTEGDDSSYSVTSSGMRARPLELTLRIHGNNVSVDGGVVAFKQLQTRENKNHPNHLEFRVSVATPSKPGKYVVDITVFDLMKPTRIRGEDADDLGGTALWRREISVE